MENKKMPNELVAELSVKSRSELDAALQFAVGSAMTHEKFRYGCMRGVLVIRHSYTELTVTLTPDVPYGEVRVMDGIVRS